MSTSVCLPLLVARIYNAKMCIIILKVSNALKGMRHENMQSFFIIIRDLEEKTKFESVRQDRNVPDLSSLFKAISVKLMIIT